MLVQDYALADTITFGATTVGPTTVTLSSLNWNGVSGLRTGFRFLVDSGEGEAIVLDDPQHESGILNVNIIKPLLGTVYNDTEWVLRVPRTKEVKDYLPRNAKSSLILPEYLESLQDVSIDELHDAIIRLRNLRRWDVMDPEYLDIFLQSMGMVLKTEQFDIETRRRFVKELPTFLELKGTRFFIQYLSFIVGAFFEIQELWSNNYSEFIDQASIPLGMESEYYPTNHVELIINAESFGIIDPNLVIEIFYILASVPLVLQRINQTFTLPDIEINSPSLVMSEDYITFEDITPEPPPPVPIPTNDLLLHYTMDSVHDPINGTDNNFTNPTAAELLLHYTMDSVHDPINGTDNNFTNPTAAELLLHYTMDSVHDPIIQ